MKYEFLVAYDYGVSRIIAALVPDNIVEIFRKDVYDLPLALVSPLRSDNDYV